VRRLRSSMASSAVCVSVVAMGSRLGPGAAPRKWRPTEITSDKRHPLRASAFPRSAAFVDGREHPTNSPQLI